MVQTALGLKCSENDIDLEKYSDLELEVMKRSNEVREKVGKLVKEGHHSDNLGYCLEANRHCYII